METEILNEIYLPFGVAVTKIELIKRTDKKYSSYIVVVNKTVIKISNSETIARQFLQKFIEKIK